MSASSPIPCVCSGGGGSATSVTGNGGGGNGGNHGDCYWAGGGGGGGGCHPSGNGQANSVTSAASGQANSVTSVLTSVSSAPATGEAFQGERGKNESGAQIVVEWNMFSEDTKDHFGPLESADDRELNPDDRGL